MIIQPDFLRHFKTRRLIQLAGDRAAPLALIHLWAHCQTSRKWEFPDLTKSDLASICEWDFPKISCGKALFLSGWIEKIAGGGYRILGWQEHNRSLINNWNRNLSGLPKDTPKAEPRGAPAGPPAADPIRTEQNRLEKIDKNRTEQGPPDAPSNSGATGPTGSGSVSFSIGGGGSGSGSSSVQQLVGNITESLTTNRPTRKQVREFMESLFRGAGEFAGKWFDNMEAQNWCDGKGRKVHDWKKLAASWASACERQKRGVSRRP